MGSLLAFYGLFLRLATGVARLASEFGKNRNGRTVQASCDTFGHSVPGPGGPITTIGDATASRSRSTEKFPMQFLPVFAE